MTFSHRVLLPCSIMFTKESRFSFTYVETHDVVLIAHLLLIFIFLPNHVGLKSVDLKVLLHWVQVQRYQ